MLKLRYPELTAGDAYKAWCLVQLCLLTTTTANTWKNILTPSGYHQNKESIEARVVKEICQAAHISAEGSQTSNPEQLLQSSGARDFVVSKLYEFD
jgi:hypothetical protein